MDASTYQTEAARTLIANADVPPFLPSNVAAAWGLVEIARELGLEIDSVKKAVFHEHGYSAPAQAHTTNVLFRMAHYAHDLGDFLDGEIAHPDQVTAAAGLRAFDVRLLWNTMGVLGEGAEIASLVLTRLESGDFDKRALQKEIGDLCWYLAALCTMADLDFGAVLAANIAKLKARYPEGWSAERSQTRDVAQEA